MKNRILNKWTQEYDEDRERMVHIPPTYLPDELFPYFDEITYDKPRFPHECPVCKQKEIMMGTLWIREPGMTANGEMVWGRVWVFCTNCHHVRNVALELRHPNWRGMPTREEARKRLGKSK